MERPREYINRVEMKKVVTEQLILRNLSMTDEQIEASITELNDMIIDILGIDFLIKDKSLEVQSTVGAWWAGIMFALDNFKQEKVDITLTSKNGEDFKVTDMQPSRK